jgi:hypothetical protein
MGRRGRRCKQLLNDLQDERGYCKLKEEALYRTLENLLSKRLWACRKTDNRINLIHVSMRATGILATEDDQAMLKAFREWINGFVIQIYMYLCCVMTYLFCCVKHHNGTDIEMLLHFPRLWTYGSFISIFSLRSTTLI